MKSILTVVLGIALCAGLWGAQDSRSPEVQLKAAIHKEEVEGDRKGAIEQYKKLANSKDRAVAAKALIRMGECYEKLGDTEAAKAYERVVRDFADQRDAVAAAQQHLVANAAQSETGIEVQRLAAYPDRRLYGGSSLDGQSISRDGRYLAFSKGDGVYVQDLAKGTERRIVAKTSLQESFNQFISPKTSPQESFDAAISPDGLQVVYLKDVRQNPGNSHSELYVIGADGSNPRLLFSGKQGEFLVLGSVSPDGRHLAYGLWKREGDGARRDLYVIDTDGSTPRLLYHPEKTEGALSTLYSPDGKHLLAWTVRDEQDGNSRILLISVGEGSSRVIGSGTGFGQFSPDGRYISFYRWPNSSSDFQGGIYIAPTDGGKEVLLAAGAASNPRWTPDGKRIVFRVQRPDQTTRRPFFMYVQEPSDFYSIRVVDGKPGGKPELMKKDVVLPGALLGATQDGKVYYQYIADESFNVYVVDLDPATGKAVSKPERLNRTFVNLSGGPVRWSYDGKLMAYGKPPEIDSPKALLIRSADTGAERQLTVSPPFDSPNCCDPQQWFPDNRSLLVFDEVKGLTVFRKVDVQTGRQEMFFQQPGSEALFGQATLSLDGKVLFFSLSKRGALQSANSNTNGANTLRLMRRNMESGEERELYQAQSPTTGFRGLILSSDGRQLTFTKSNTDNTASQLTIPIEGGEARELYRSDLLLATRAWTKDMRHILVAQSDPGSGMQQIWSVPTEGGKPIPTGLTFPVFGGASIHPDGRRFTYTGRQPGQTELWVMKLLPPGAKPPGK
jgi:Tol biopolymer transport system component